MKLVNFSIVKTIALLSVKLVNAKAGEIDPALYQQSPDCLTFWAWLPQLYPRGVTSCCDITAANKDSFPIIITCDQNLRITKINIGSLYNPALATVKGNWKSLGIGKLNAQLPAYLGNLTELTTFYITEAFLYGQIPKEFSKLTKLKYFSVGYNSLTGDVPEGLFKNMNSLVALDISHNKFSGPIPNSFIGLPSLISIQLGSNQFSGALPDLSTMKSIGTGPKYDVEDGGFTPVCDLNNLGPKSCIAKGEDLSKVPNTCVLPSPSLKVCVAETIKSSPTPIYAEAIQPKKELISEAGKIGIIVSSIILFLVGGYMIGFHIIKRGNRKAALEEEQVKKERIDRSSD
ncbi:hypothetical protein HDU92_003017 [Lobulomyces angularis]|nr:hypothetical protein HDU92_003017 [Lobulomyces angularis]